MENLIQSIDSYFSDEFTSQLANSLDETQAGIQKAISAIIPLSLQRLTTISENGLEGQNEITRITSDAAQYYAHSPNLSKLHNDERGSDLPLKIFGNDKNHLAKKVADFSGTRESSADRLLTLAVPVIAGKLGNYFQENNLSGNGLSQFLSSKKVEFENRIPGEYKNAGNSSTHISKKKRFPTWVMFAIIILIFLLLIYFSRGCNSPDKVTTMSNHIHDLFLV